MKPTSSCPCLPGRRIWSCSETTQHQLLFPTVPTAQLEGLAGAAQPLPREAGQTLGCESLPRHCSGKNGLQAIPGLFLKRCPPQLTLGILKVTGGFQAEQSCPETEWVCLHVHNEKGCDVLADSFSSPSCLVWLCPLTACIDRITWKRKCPWSA